MSYHPEPNDGRGKELFILFTLTLLALATRAYGIWDWSLIGDEYYTITHAAERSTSFINPAYYALVLGSLNAFGLTEWSARLPSVILGSLSVPVFYVACRSLFGRKTALLGSLFILFNGWHLYHSQLSRFYSGVFLFGVLSYFLYYSALQRDSYWLLGGALLSNALGVLFHATAVMVPASCALFSAWILLWKRKDTSTFSRRIAVTHLTIWSVLGVIALPLLLQILGQWQGKARSQLTEPLTILFQLVGNVEIILAVSSLFGFLYLIQKDVLKGIFFALGIGIPLGALLVAGIVAPPVRAKYMIYTLPLIITLSALLCVEIGSAVSRYRFTMHVVPFLIIAGMMPGFISHYTGKKSLDVREAIEVIEQGYIPDDIIVAFSDSFNHLLRNYPAENLRILGGRGIWRQALLPIEQEHHRAWIILNTYRNTPLRQDLQSWLTEHASLVWRKYERRYDYSMMGYEVWLVR